MKATYSYSYEELQKALLKLQEEKIKYSTKTHVIIVNIATNPNAESTIVVEPRPNGEEVKGFITYLKKVWLAIVNQPKEI